MRFLFVMDPAETMLPDKDTTFAFIRGAMARGHESLHCLPRDVYNEGRDVFAVARPITVSDAPPHVTLGARTEVELSKLDATFIRKDPPFDAAYLYLTQQLDLLGDRTLVINDPSAVRDANEKLFAFQFAEFMPRSLVTSERARILEFVERVGGAAVLKPLDGAGGSGVVALRRGDKNVKSLVDMLTLEGRRLALVQEFLPDVTQGDKRVLVLDGAPLGAILRVPQPDDIRANIHVGGRVEATELTEAEAKLVQRVGERLSAVGLFFVGLDLIGERLIEVNVTSPTGIQELGRFLGRPVEADVMAWVEQRVLERGR